MIKNWKTWLGIFVLAIAFIALLAGCASTETNTEQQALIAGETAIQTAIVTNVSAQEAHMLVQEKSGDPGFKVIDVRTPDEYNTGHVEGAVNIDYNSNTFREDIGKLDKTSEYLVYCRSGNRSSGAVKVMEELGFAMIYHMNGGIIEWNSEGLPFAR